MKIEPILVSKAKRSNVTL